MNVNNIAQSLGLTDEQVMKEFKDARVISRFSEYWAGRMYDYIKVDNTNNASYDGIIQNKLLGDIKVSIKSLTKSGVHFQQSKFIGSGRICTNENLLQSLRDINFVIVVDIINFPSIKFIPISSEILINLVNQKLLSCNGYNENKFYKTIFNTNSEDIKFIEFNIYDKKQSINIYQSNIKDNVKIKVENDNLKKSSNITRPNVIKQILRDSKEKIEIKDVIEIAKKIKPLRSTTPDRVWEFIINHSKEYDIPINFIKEDGKTFIKLKSES
jgi:hypothetical protein